jgi:hypothetical protein
MLYTVRGKPPNGTRISRRRLWQRAPRVPAPQAVDWMRLLYGWREWAKPPCHHITLLARAHIPASRALYNIRARDFSFTLRRAV